MNETILAPPEAESPQAIARGRRICREVTRAHARTFYLASHGLPPAVREHAYAVYGFCRWADNAVDDAADLADAEARLAIARNVLEDVYGEGPVAPALLALRQTVRSRAMPRGPFEELLQGMAMDLRESRYADFDRLRVYCYRAAGVVGLMMAHIFGFQDPRCLAHAVDLGIAMQLTNILRDIREDLTLGRVYLPQDELARFDLGDEDLRRGIVDDRFRDFLRFQVARARSYYRSAEAGIPDLLGLSSRRTARVMGRLYGEILGEIERQDFDVFRARARVSLPRKLRIMARAELTTWAESARRGTA